MHVTILCTAYYPEPNGISIYSTDLATYLDAMGHQVRVITTRKLRDSNEEDAHRATKIETVRISVRNTTSRNVFLSIFNETLLALGFWRVSKKEKLHSDSVIISIIPSLSTGIAASQISKRCGVPHLTIFQDFTSLGSRQIGSRLGKIVAPLIERIERNILEKSRRIVVVSEEMVTTVNGLNPKLSNKVHLIHNYFINKDDADEMFDFRQCFGIDKSKFVIMHTGNIGRKQGIENVLSAAKLLHGEQRIMFVIIGGGNQEEKISVLASRLTNVLILPFQPEGNYAKILRSADMLLINELPTQLGMSLPSKSTAYLDSGVPIIAAVPIQGPTSRFLNEKALIVKAGSPEVLAYAVLRVFHGEIDLQKNATRGKKFAEQNLDANKARLKYSKILDSLLPKIT